MLLTMYRTLISALQSQRALAMENLALRHQLLILQRTAEKPRLRRADRALLLSRFWASWRETLAIVQPETVIRWHREGFRLPEKREPFGNRLIRGARNAGHEPGRFVW